MNIRLADIELDQSGAGYELSNGTTLSLDHYTQVYCVNTFNNSESTTSLISIQSELKGYLLIFTDGVESGPIFVGVGTENIPYNINYNHQLSMYFRPNEEVGDDTFPSNLVNINVL
ncbi:hypothetical protein [Lysinibacillus sp.]|uniref:hypothetical protein n=1 Tax=Lysinibacillus sp. TaxID=1869345 RepID=UPI0028A7B28A|nr:hypothetical protein [Lysinibacillus sp.]